MILVIIGEKVNEMGDISEPKFVRLIIKLFYCNLILEAQRDYYITQLIKERNLKKIVDKG